MPKLLRRIFGTCISRNLELNTVKEPSTNLGTLAVNAKNIDSLENLKNSRCIRLNIDLSIELLQIPEKNLQISEDGNFANLCGGLHKSSCLPGGQQMRVKVKRPRSKQDDSVLLEEIRTMHQIKPHPNVLTLIGYTMDTKNTPILIMEYCENGSLLDYLRSHQSTFVYESATDTAMKDGQIERLEKNSKFLSTSDLLSFAYQLADGMSYLASLKFVHGNLSCRNVFVSWDRTLRIGDFSGPRPFDDLDNRETNPFANWLAPEVIDALEFSEKSDVWAFAVCLYEIFSLGDLENGKSLEKPEFCPLQIYDLLMICWNKDPHRRPSFSDCRIVLKQQCDELNLKIMRELSNKLCLVSMHQMDLRSMIFP